MRLLSFFLSLIVSISSCAFTLKPDSPSRYVVQPGDTLWEIANRYLQHPWEWTALWHANPHIKNPNQLYPGAVIELRYHHHQPYLHVLSNGTVKLSPRLHTTALNAAIPPIPLSDIKPFLDSSLVLDRNVMAEAPYVIAFVGDDEQMLAGQGDKVYVKNLCPRSDLRSGETLSYGIYRSAGEYTNPYTKAFLGYKATLIGYGELMQRGDPATVVLTDIREGVQPLDKVMPNNYPGFDLNFMPKVSSSKVKGLIIDTLGDYSQGAEGLVVVLDRGKAEGVQAGDVFAVYTKAKRMKDLECPYGCVRLPRERVGEIMVFRTFTQTSFALVVRSTRAVKVTDRFTTP